MPTRITTSPPLLRLEKLDEAMEHIEIARELGIDPLKMQMTLGDIRWARGDFAGALDAYRSAIRYDLHRAYSRMLFNMSSSPAFEPEEWVVEASATANISSAMRIRSSTIARSASRRRMHGRCASASCRATCASIRSGFSWRACSGGSTGRVSSRMPM
jgi:tetratricopeptide (TPR) repeat protein